MALCDCLFLPSCISNYKFFFFFTTTIMLATEWLLYTLSTHPSLNQPYSALWMVHVSFLWIKAVSKPMTSMRHWIRGDRKPVCQQVCAAEYYSCTNNINKQGKYFQKEASNPPQNQGQGGDEDTKTELLATEPPPWDPDNFQHTLIVLNTAIWCFGLYSSDALKSKYELKATFKM